MHGAFGLSCLYNSWVALMGKARQVSWMRDHDDHVFNKWLLP